MTIAKHCSVVSEVPNIVNELKQSHKLEWYMASCLLKLTAKAVAIHPDIAPTSTIAELKTYALDYHSWDKAAWLTVTLAHNEKGLTVSHQIVGQPDMFPLERSLEEGGNSLAQEPCVAYVVQTRATFGLYFLKMCTIGEDSNMQSTYFEQ